MKTKYSIWTVAFALLIIASCKKSSTSQARTLQGTWNFEYEQVHTQSTIEYTSGATDYKTVTVSNYTTANNYGQLNVTSTMMNSIGLTYTITDTAIGYNYQNGAFVDSTISIQNAAVPATNTNSSYVLVGSDSVYFPAGSFNTPSGYQTAGGARINISGDTLLTITTSFNRDSSIFIYGVPATANYQATLISKFN